ncbi:MAG: LysM peptidoglycan-binding domain-containing protein [Spirochaetes bacterium]|nr:LysM peptidoglycan-binding domain-containing protein [Spirochaetota bacterium]
MQKTIFSLVFILIFSNVVIAREQIHLVRQGETLYSISRLYNVSLDEILVVNQIENPARIRAGFNLIIPSRAPRQIEHTVKRGDTLFAIARAHNVSVNDLLRENNLDQNAVIRVGQIIRIPCAQTPGTQVAPGRTAPSNADNRFFWPVRGEMRRLSGKLQGSKILANYGDPVFSVSSGRVVWEGPYRGFGRVVFVESPAGYVFVYGGNATTSVRAGDFVKPGVELGRVGLNLYENRPTMFFAVYRGGQPVDVKTAPRL